MRCLTKRDIVHIHRANDNIHLLFADQPKNVPSGFYCLNTATLPTLLLFSSGFLLDHLHTSSWSFSPSPSNLAGSTDPYSAPILNLLKEEDQPAFQWLNRWKLVCSLQESWKIPSCSAGTQILPPVFKTWDQWQDAWPNLSLGADQAWTVGSLFPELSGLPSGLTLGHDERCSFLVSYFSEPLDSFSPFSLSFQWTLYVSVQGLIKSQRCGRPLSLFALS